MITFMDEHKAKTVDLEELEEDTPVGSSDAN